MLPKKEEPVILYVRGVSEENRDFLRHIYKEQGFKTVGDFLNEVLDILRIEHEILMPYREE